MNESLTTARFSGLYGLWYPHGTSDVTFVRLLYSQVRATKLAMLAIRKVNPAAQLVQTEDLGRVHSTAALAPQAAFENHRWLTFDLLCGAVTPRHPLWHYLRTHGLRAADLNELRYDPLPPDILGINYYATSERFLDERLAHYPGQTALPAAGRGPAYADVEVLRVAGQAPVGPGGRAARSLGPLPPPLAVTESHLGCTREEQMRWLHQAHATTNGLRAEGVDVRGLTVWALLGACDWDSLLTRDGASYESGVFDVRAGQPRPTALFRMVQDLAHRGHHAHPVLHGPGWWQRPLRFCYFPT